MSKKIDLTGQVFGRLTVVGAAPNRIGPNGAKKTYWYCLCSCGKTKEVAASSLRRSLTASCGCSRKKISLIGQVFGLYTVIKPAPSRPSKRGTRTYWVCRCSCGAIKQVRTRSLIEGTTLSCGCKKKHNLIGKTYGQLTVIAPALTRMSSGGNPQAYWSCRCSCGTIKEVAANELKKGSTISCGCYRDSLVGPNHYNWKPYLSETHRIHHRLRITLNQTTGLSQKVLRRDNYTCYRCGQHHGSLAAHHIMPWASYPSLRYAPENCITLCEYCHDEFHSIYGKEDFDDEDLNEYLSA